jgi:hypothetical protein
LVSNSARVIPAKLASGAISRHAAVKIPIRSAVGGYFRLVAIFLVLSLIATVKSRRTEVMHSRIGVLAVPAAEEDLRMRART